MIRTGDCKMTNGVDHGGQTHHEAGVTWLHNRYEHCSNLTPNP
jgi:hypothetical protein